MSERDQSFFNFDVVLAANLIDRLYDPAAFLTTIHARINPGGFLIILSPYTWLPEYTPKDSWIGGKRVDGENVTTKDGLEVILSPWFDLVDNLNAGDDDDDDESGSNSVSSFHVPMVIRETERKHQYTFSECTIWKKRV